jgi:vitamin B12 transport system substrate-binding protein
MLKFILILFLAFSSAFSSVSYAKAYQRIITLAPHATEIAFAAGLGKQIIAVSELSDYPPETVRLEKVASYQGIKLERILALKPDLVIAWPAGNPVRELEKLAQLGIEIYRTDASTLEEIGDSIEALSRFAHDPQIGLANARQFRRQLQQLKQQYQNKTPVSYFYQLSDKPIITMAQDNWPSEVFRFCGGRNAFADNVAPYPQVGIEQVVLAKPEVIFSSQHAMNNGAMWSEWDAIPAVHNHHMWTLNADWINRATPRTLLAVKQVCEYFDLARQKH